MRNSYWAHALEPWSLNYWAHVPQLLKPACPKALSEQVNPPQWEALAPKLENNHHPMPQLEKSLHNNDDPEQPKTNT